MVSLAKQPTVKSVDLEIAELDKQITAFEIQRTNLEKEIGAHFLGDTTDFENKLNAVLAKLRGANSARQLLLDKRKSAEAAQALAQYTELYSDYRNASAHADNLKKALIEKQAELNALNEQYRVAVSEVMGIGNTIPQVENKLRSLGVTDQQISTIQAGKH